ncbi:MAG: YigZ family protein [Bacilli bacterium]|nr:YigZ family protein [Bacilli bacterium]
MLISEYEITIKKSKFIGLLYDIKDVSEVKPILENLKKEHSKARHMPYAYVIGNTAKKTDDKEPHNTAGIQIYNQLVMNNLDHHLLVVIRYYGGTKLGAGNLLRTYLNCAKGCISK